jgi:chromosomal replication initiation ATPase DnaA
MRDLVAEMHTLSESINRDLAALDGQAANVRPDVACIQSAIADAYQIPVAMLLSRLRSQPLPEARHLGIVLAMDLLKMHPKEAALAFNVVREMACHAERNTNARADTNAEFAKRRQMIRDAAAARISELRAKGPRLAAA